MRRRLVITATVTLLAACPGQRKVYPGPGEDGASLPPDGPGARRDGPPVSQDRGPVSQDRGPVGKEAGTTQKTCSASGVTFTVFGDLQPNTKVKITVRAPECLANVLVGVKGPNPGISWVGHAIDISCTSSPCAAGDTCSWTFPEVSVQPGGGPYSLHFMKDAVNDNPSVGQEIASCTP